MHTPLFSTTFLLFVRSLYNVVPGHKVLSVYLHAVPSSLLLCSYLMHLVHVLFQV